MKQFIYTLTAFLTISTACCSNMPSQERNSRNPKEAAQQATEMAAQCSACQCIEGTDCAAVCNKCINNTVPAEN